LLLTNLALATALPIKYGLKLTKAIVELEKLPPCYGTSNKIRIETQDTDYSSGESIGLATALPIKYGLKHNFLITDMTQPVTCYGTSNKIRIET